MAKIKTGSVVAQIRNSIGGETYTANRYGAVVRSKISPIQPRTSRQTTVRSAFSVASKGWTALTATQQAAWNAFAASHPISDVFGDSRILAGNAAYTRVTANRALCGLSANTTPPATGGLFPSASSAVGGVGSTGVITVTTAAQTVSTGFYLVASTPGLSTGSYFAGSKQRLAGAFVATVGAATTFTVTAPTYNSKLGFAATQIILVRVTRMDINGYVYDTVSYRVTAT